MNTFYDIARTFAELFVESAPWLMLGLLVAGLMKAFVPTSLLARHLGGRGVGSTVKAAFIGAPLPLCSCGVIPAALGLRRSGASKNATVSFLISTPETGVDSISISYALLGPFMAIIRPIAAICSAITAGLLVGRAVEEPVQQMATETASAEKASCCS
ncbi:MAG: permease, partial [Pseudomonadota bacterium]